MLHLVVFSHLRWNFVHQRPQHLLSRLAQQYKVLFVEEPVFADGPARLETRQAAPNVDVLLPHTPVQAPGYDDSQLAAIEPLVTGHLRQHGIDDYLVWFYTPMAFPMLAAFDPRAVIYDCMDELSAFKNAPPQLRNRETALLQAADIVFTGGPSLYEAKRNRHPNVLCLPSAVDAAHYSPQRDVAGSAASLQAEALQGGIAGPRLGFFGVIDERLDVSLVERLADACAEWQIVMVGPIVKIDPAQLPRRPNIHWLGQQTYELLPHLVAGWDVCLLPFALNESTRFISPTKTLEYMAAEKPIVSTPVRDVASLYGEVVCVARHEEAFIAGCRRALAETTLQRSQRIAAMRACVSRCSWDATAQTIHRAIQEILVVPPRRGGVAAPMVLDASVTLAPAAARPGSRVVPLVPRAADVDPARAKVRASSAGRGGVVKSASGS